MDEFKKEYNSIVGNSFDNTNVYKGLKAQEYRKMLTPYFTFGDKNLRTRINSII